MRTVRCDAHAAEVRRRSAQHQADSTSTCTCCRANAAQPASPPPLTMAVLSRDEILKAIEKKCASPSASSIFSSPRSPLSGRIGSAPRCNSVAALSLPSCPPFPAREALGSRHRNHPAFESPCSTSAFFSSFLRSLRSSFSEPLLSHNSFPSGLPLSRHLCLPLTQLHSPPPPAPN